MSAWGGTTGPPELGRPGGRQSSCGEEKKRVVTGAAVGGEDLVRHWLGVHRERPKPIALQPALGFGVQARGWVALVWSRRISSPAGHSEKEWRQVRADTAGLAEPAGRFRQLAQRASLPTRGHRPRERTCRAGARAGDGPGQRVPPGQVIRSE